MYLYFLIKVESQLKSALQLSINDQYAGSSATDPISVAWNYAFVTVCTIITVHCQNVDQIYSFEYYKVYKMITLTLTYLHLFLFTLHFLYIYLQSKMYILI